jgi:hypothetical protein
MTGGKDDTRIIGQLRKCQLVPFGHFVLGSLFGKLTFWKLTISTNIQLIFGENVIAQTNIDAYHKTIFD